MPTIYPSADLPSIFIKHFTNKVEKLGANIASEHVASVLVTGTTAATFSSFEKVSQLTVKECILNSAPKSCELDPIPSKLLIECLDSILHSLTDLFNSSLASSHNASIQFLSHLFSKKRCLDHNDLNNYRHVSNLRFIDKILLLKLNRRKEPKTFFQFRMIMYMRYFLGITALQSSLVKKNLNLGRPQ